MQHFLRPHFYHFGGGVNVVNPWCVKVRGPRISLGEYVNIVATSEHRVFFEVWSTSEGKGEIQIGDYTIVNPGDRFSSAESITIGPNCMIASRVMISDSDWHGIYDRVYTSGNPKPVKLEENVWIGDNAMVLKGTTIGKNSIIGAGSVVVKDIPPNTIAAGNPAKPVKKLDPNRNFITREQALADPEHFYGYLLDLERENFKQNTTLGWLRYLLFPRKGD